nr:response regulator [Luteimonas sp. BDR2-5]
MIVDDSRDDAELVELALCDAGMAIDCRRVHDEAGLVEALRDFLPQLVLSDVNLPGFSGAQALALARAALPGVPVVLMTGALEGLDDDTPQADALVLKDELDALPAIAIRLLATGGT